MMDEKISAEARILARELSECSHALEAAASASLPCNKVVKWQVGEFIKLGKSRKEAVQSLHKPEPWAGNLESARILWLGSNPSFSAEEKFPDWMGGWSDEATIDFFTRRFVADPEVRGYGAADTGEGCRDRVIEVGGKLSKAAVRTWTRIRNISALILMAGREIGNSLVYGTVGAAHAKANVGGTDLSDSGLVYGVGFDYAVNDRWTVGGEVLEHKFDNFDASGVDFDATTVKAKVGLKF